ncbi:F0F1 ATP synthase subunit gamma [Phaeovulum sp. W22_SRMD_FR3]|uniref:F0F1 ATP synthase subunit gamma n=1 Tax=Phaeovulum sp. W22_SRMD_FR3 TaxID=3240274 RepID=UPI003F9DE93E
MTQTLETLAHHTATLTSIRGIVRTMKTMSAINALPYELAARSIDTYRETVRAGLHAFICQNGPIPTALAPGTPEVIIAFGSDHGLCGNYNDAVAEAVLQHPADRLICVGAQLQDALEGRGLTPEMVLMAPASTEGLGRLAGLIVTRLEAMRRAAPAGAIAVRLVHTERGQHGQQMPVAPRLLPLDPALIAGLAATPWTSRSLPQVAAPAADTLAALIREMLFTGVFRAAAEALVTENAARLARMQQAEQSVDDRLESLAADTRALRQSEITTELLDVIIGFEALRGRGKRPEPPAAPAG